MGPDGSSLNSTIADNQNGQYIVRYVAYLIGNYTLVVKVNHEQIIDSPFHPVFTPGLFKISILLVLQ